MAGNRPMKRHAKLGWVLMDSMRVREEISQRKFNPAWANEIAKDFDPESFTPPIVNKSGENYWVVDGQHRLAAYKTWLGEWCGQKIECWVYEDLTEKEEADLFDRLNNQKRVGLFDRFQVRLTAEREDETRIAEIVRHAKLKLSRSRSEGALSCVGALAKVYALDADSLARDLHIVYQSFGDSGLEADIIEGIGLLVSRYNGQLNDASAIRALSAARGGVNALRSRSEHLRVQMAAKRAPSIAAAAIEIINRGNKGKKLPSWWKSEAAK